LEKVQSSSRLTVRKDKLDNIQVGLDELVQINKAIQAQKSKKSSRILV